MARFEMLVPEMGLSDEPMRVTAWLVREGSWVDHDEPVLEVTAGSVVVDLPAPVSGVLVEHRVAEDDLVRPSSPVAIFETNRPA